MQPPKVRFITKVNLPSVGANGAVDPKKQPALVAWQPHNSIETVLTSLKQEMNANKKQAQPPEGQTY